MVPKIAKFFLTVFHSVPVPAYVAKIYASDDADMVHKNSLIIQNSNT
jgi:hypothetical protein